MESGRRGYAAPDRVIAAPFRPLADEEVMPRTPRTEAYLRGYSDARKDSAARVEAESETIATRKMLAEQIRKLKPRTGVEAPKEK